MPALQFAERILEGNPLHTIGLSTPPSPVATAQVLRERLQEALEELEELKAEQQEQFVQAAAKGGQQAGRRAAATFGKENL